jgi:hypothetical protein
MLTWNLGSNGISWVQHNGRLWKLIVVFTGLGLERQYFLHTKGFREEIRTEGGVYTALDIAAAFIEHQSSGLTA